jgi:RES domain
MTLDECDRLFRSVRSASTLAEACYALTPVVDAYKLLEVSAARQSVFWRARVCGDTPWPTIASMWYPPAELAPVGRLNDERSPMFYAATHEDTALAEIPGVTEGAYVQVAAFKNRPGEELRLTSVGEFAHVYKAGYMRMVGDDPGNAINHLIRENSVPRARELLYIDAFLASILSDPKANDSQYRLTRALASMVLKDAETEGILYPSVRDTIGTNIALRPSAVHQKLIAVLCFHARVRKVRSFGFVDLEFLREAAGMTDSGSLNWRRHDSTHQYTFFNMTQAEYERAMRLQRKRGQAANEAITAGR